MDNTPGRQRLRLAAGVSLRDKGKLEYNFVHWLTKNRKSTATTKCVSLDILFKKKKISLFHFEFGAELVVYNIGPIRIGIVTLGI